VFGTGLAVWRFWSVSSGKSEIFDGNGPAVRTDELIESVKLHCSDDIRILYVGDREPDGFYVRYRLFPRNVSVLLVNGVPDPIEDEILSRVEKELGEGKGSCLMIDAIGLNIPIAYDRFNVNEQQSVLLFSGSE
jgi:hypothetical protein